MNKIYAPDPSFSTRIDHVDQSDVAAFKKMAGIITKGCTTDKQKVDAIAKWVKNNMIPIQVLILPQSLRIEEETVRECLR